MKKLWKFMVPVRGHPEFSSPRSIGCRSMFIPSSEKSKCPLGSASRSVHTTILSLPTSTRITNDKSAFTSSPAAFNNALRRSSGICVPSALCFSVVICWSISASSSSSSCIFVFNVWLHRPARTAFVPASSCRLISILRARRICIRCVATLIISFFSSRIMLIMFSMFPGFPRISRIASATMFSSSPAPICGLSHCPVRFSLNTRNSNTSFSS